jgi:hypothetical protein
MDVKYDPLFLITVGFVLALAPVVMVLALGRSNRYISPGYPTPMYSANDPGSRINVSRLFFYPVLITCIVVILALTT